MENQNILNEAILKFLEPGDFSFEETIGGVNNLSRYVKDHRNVTYILRVYNNGNDSKRVTFEHAVLDELHKLNEFSFQIPTVIPSKEDHLSHVLLSNGAEASLFERIPGYLPKLTMTKEIGLASGELTTALGKITPVILSRHLSSPNPPYYDLYKVHHAITRDLFFQRIEESDFDKYRQEINEVKVEIQFLEELVSKLLSLDLPITLIHGDLHYDNILVENDRVTGLLDFEFAAFDWRTMELAICLSKYAGEPNPETYFELFIEGYMTTLHPSFSNLEVSVIPDVINLRILSNVIYFTGRLIAGEDELPTLTKRLRNYLNRIEWIKSHKNFIISKIEQYQQENQK